jgi:rare lipoprotein A
MDYDSGTFALQVGSFTVKANAYRYVDELQKRYGTADVRETVIKGTRYYRVRLGRYGSLKEAESKRQLYERSDFKGCFVVAAD